jgi:hypothetical protein
MIILLQTILWFKTHQIKSLNYKIVEYIVNHYNSFSYFFFMLVFVYYIHNTLKISQFCPNNALKIDVHIVIQVIA